MKNINIVLSYKYVNKNRDTHFENVIFKGGEITIEELKEVEARLVTLLTGKNTDGFIASQVGVQELFDFVPSYEADSSWHRFTGCDFTRKNATDKRSFAEFAKDVMSASQEGWMTFDVLEKKTGRIPRKRYIKEIDQLSNGFTKEIKQLNTLHAKEMVKADKTNANEVMQLNKSHAKEAKLLNETYTKETLRLKTNHTKEMELMGDKHNKALKLIDDVSEIIGSYMEGEATSDELEKAGKNAKKVIASLSTKNQ